MRLDLSSSVRASRRIGATLVEVLIAASIAVMVLTAFMVLVVETSKEQRWGIVETQLHAQSGLLQDKLTRLLREMSASESAIFGDPIAAGSPFFRRVIVAQGQASAAPRQELIYNATAKSLTLDPNRAVSGDESALFSGNSAIKLRNMYFYPSMKPGGVPDSSSINVWFELDDDGTSGRVKADGTPRMVSVVRSFTVTMRNF
jgi:hypothetical protein